MPVAARHSQTILDVLTPDAIHGAFSEEALETGRLAVEVGRVSRPSLR